jgi:hypothetical protein
LVPFLRSFVRRPRPVAPLLRQWQWLGGATPTAQKERRGWLLAALRVYMHVCICMYVCVCVCIYVYLYLYL